MGEVTATAAKGKLCFARIEDDQGNSAEILIRPGATTLTEIAIGSRLRFTLSRNEIGPIGTDPQIVAPATADNAQPATPKRLPRLLDKGEKSGSVNREYVFYIGQADPDDHRDLDEILSDLAKEWRQRAASRGVKLQILGPTPDRPGFFPGLRVRLSGNRADVERLADMLKFSREAALTN
jgi:hypothetical protein